MMSISNKNFPTKPKSGGIPAKDKKVKIIIIEKNLLELINLKLVKLWTKFILKTKKTQKILINKTKYTTIFNISKLKPYSNM
tara:strand:- start:201 stop:446 length:246 start_codon:yes stop_codon:yes gene_type:complete